MSLHLPVRIPLGCSGGDHKITAEDESFSPTDNSLTAPGTEIQKSLINILIVTSLSGWTLSYSPNSLFLISLYYLAQYMS